MENTRGSLSFGCENLQLFTTQRSITTTTQQSITKLLYQGAVEGHTLRIITYSLPTSRRGIKYIREFFKRPDPPWFQIIAHEKFAEQAKAINAQFSENVKIRLKSAVHSKVLLIEPDIVVVGSSNFGDSDWHETSVLMKSSQAYEWYFRNEWKKLWKEGMKLDKPSTTGRTRLL